MPPLKIAVCVPAYQMRVDGGQVPMWLSLGAALAANEDKFQLVHTAVVSQCPVDFARNQITHRALEAGADWAFSIDADVFYTTPTGADGSDILQWLWDGQKREAAVIGAPVLARRKDAQRMVLRKAGDAWRHLDESEYKDQVVEADRIATAFFAVNLNWLRSCWPTPPWFETKHFADERGAPMVTGEDYGFCDAVRARGGTILCDGRIFPSHAAGRKIMGEDDL